jgi:hypothetical protein
VRDDAYDESLAEILGVVIGVAFVEKELAMMEADIWSFWLVLLVSRRLLGNNDS